MSVIRCEHCGRSVDTDLKPTHEICEGCADHLTTDFALAEHLDKTVAVAADAVNRANQAEATNAALVNALWASVEVMEFAYMNAPKQPKEIEKARKALRLAKGE